MTKQEQTSTRPKVYFEILPDGRGKVLVDDIDLSNRVSKLEISAEAGEITEVVLYIRAANVVVMGSAVVTHKMLIIDPQRVSSPEEIIKQMDIDELYVKEFVAESVRLN